MKTPTAMSAGKAKDGKTPLSEIIEV